MVVATMDAGVDIERFGVHFQRLLVLALISVDNGDVVVRRRHVRVLRSEHTCSEGHLVDILLKRRDISSLFKNEEISLLYSKMHLIYYSNAT